MLLRNSIPDMLPYRDSRLTRIVLGLFFLAVVGYAYFEARGLLFGPVISIPSTTMQISGNPYILIQGTATRIASLSMDAQPVSVTEDGAFKIPYVLSPGVNRIVIDAKDKYGNSAQKVVEVVYTPSSTSTALGLDMSTSTPGAVSATSTAPGTSTSAR